LQHDLEVLKQRYEHLKQELQNQRQNWRVLLQSFGHLHAQGA
jgi:hypothetical protein